MNERAEKEQPVTATMMDRLSATLKAGLKGYDAYASAAGALRRMGEAGFLNGFLDATALGTPAQVIEKYRARRDLIGPFEAAPAFRFGGIPFDEAEASMRLFAAEVMPELKSWG